MFKKYKRTNVAEMREVTKDAFQRASFRMSAFVGEQINKGTDLPIDIFNVYMGNKVKIKKGK